MTNKGLFPREFLKRREFLKSRAGLKARCATLLSSDVPYCTVWRYFLTISKEDWKVDLALISGWACDATSY